MNLIGGTNDYSKTQHLAKSCKLQSIGTETYIVFGPHMKTLKAFEFEEKK